MMKVSVIIPTYNREQLLKRAIQSVLNQTFRDFEIIVVDDGSTDNTKEIIDSFTSDKIKYIYESNSGGAARPKNTGIKNAQGKYIAVLDSDDEWLPQKLEKQIELLEIFQDPKLGAVGCDVFVFENGYKTEYKIPKHKNIP